MRVFRVRCLSFTKGPVEGYVFHKGLGRGVSLSKRGVHRVIGIECGLFFHIA